MNGVLSEVVIATIGDALEFAPSPREEELDIGGTRRIVTEFVGIVRTHAQTAFGNSEIEVPAKTLGAPVLVPLLRVFGRNEEFEFHLFELTRAEHKVAGRNFVSERFTDLRNTERRFLAAGLQHIGKINEHALCSFGAQIRNSSVGLHGTGLSLEHEIKVARFGKRIFLATRRTGRGVF